MTTTIDEIIVDQPSSPPRRKEGLIGFFSKVMKRKMCFQQCCDSRRRESERMVYTYDVEIVPVDHVEPESGEATDECTMSINDSVAAVEVILMYNFKDKSLLEEALTHSSYTDSPSYQRLEFVGDAALGLAISNFVYFSYPDLEPGQLSLLRAANISTEKLARVAVRHGLHKYVRHKATVLSDKVREFVNAVEEEEQMVVHGGQMKAPKVLADIVESVAAAVYVDCGLNLQSMWSVIRPLLEPLVMLKVLEKQPQPITTLFETCQKAGKQVDIKHWRKGDRNIASVYVDGRFVASGSSENKENAKLHAAEVALSKFTQSDSMKPQICGDPSKAAEIENPRQKVQEICRKKRWSNPTYSILDELGPAHERRYISSVEVEISDKILMVRGHESSKVKDAHNSAASVMFYALQDSGLI